MEESGGENMAELVSPDVKIGQFCSICNTSNLHVGMKLCSPARVPKFNSIFGLFNQ